MQDTEVLVPRNPDRATTARHETRTATFDNLEAETGRHYRCSHTDGAVLTTITVDSEAI